MSRIILADKEFEKFIPHETIDSAVLRISEQINQELAGEDVLFICILNGAFIFASELMQKINILESEISFLKLSSYEGTDTTGKVNELIGLNEPIEGRIIVIIEDIVDTGNTIIKVIETLKKRNPKSIKIAALLVKPGKFNNKMKIDYPGLEIGNDFIVGYGLDYNRKGRNLKDIYKVVE